MNQQKLKFYTPLVIAISIIIGLMAFVLSTDYLFRLIKPSNKSISIQNIKIDSSDIKIIRRKIDIDSILYDSLSISLSTKKGIRKKSNLSLSKLNKYAYLNMNPSVFNWILFHGVALSLSLASSIFLFFILFELYSKYKKYFKAKTWASIFVCLIALAISLWYISVPFPVILTGAEIMDYFNIVFNEPERATKFIITPLFIIALIPILGILVINSATYSLLQANKENKLKKDLMSEYVYLNDRINILALYLGVLVSFAVIGSGLQRNMIIGQIPDLSILYPAELVYGYGISFSIILALFFIPSSLYLKFLAKRIFPEKKIVKGRWSLIGKESYENFKLGFSILLPIISSIIQPMLS